MTVAMMDPEDQFTINGLRLATGKPIIAKVGLLSEIDAALDVQYGEDKSKMDKLIADSATDDLGEEDLAHLKIWPVKHPSSKWLI